jgi:hypothetical protein
MPEIPDAVHLPLAPEGNIVLRAVEMVKRAVGKVGE